MKISIIVPIYNSGKTIRRCIESIVHQSFQEYELILVDDGSTDNSKEICKEYLSNKVVLYENSNHGVSYSRNFGLMHATGDYITFCDSDDYYDKDHLLKMLNAALENDSDITICGYTAINREGESTRFCYKQSWKLRDIDLVQSIVRDNNIGGFCWNKLFNKDILQEAKFPDDLLFLEDTYFLFSALKNTSTIYYLAEPLSFYCYSDNSVTRDINKVISANNKSYYTVSYERILSDFKYSGTMAELLKCLIFQTAVGTERGYLKIGGNNRAFIYNLNSDIAKYYKTYFHSCYISNRAKIENLMKIILMPLTKVIHK